MIRSLTCVCALLAGASGLYLYSEKHRTTLLDQQISKIVSDTQQIRERTSMLRAEWALLNQPDRLQQLSGRFLPQLGAMAPTQFVQLASLDARLPAVGPENPPHPIATPQTAPSLVGAKPEQAGPPVAEGAAIAQADPSRQAGHVAVQAVAQAGTQAGAQSGTQSGAQSGAQSALQAAVLAGSQQVAARNPARLAQAHPKAPAHRDVELADTETGDGSDSARQDVVPQAALHRVAAHAAAHSAHVAAPVRLASVGVASTRPAISAVSSAYARPPVIAAAAWHPARAAWPVARPASYSVPVSAMGGSAIGSSLGSSHASLPAPVPVADGN